MDPRRAAVINVVIDGPLGGAAGHPMKIKEETNGGDVHMPFARVEQVLMTLAWLRDHPHEALFGVRLRTFSAAMDADRLCNWVAAEDRSFAILSADNDLSLCSTPHVFIKDGVRPEVRVSDPDLLPFSQCLFLLQGSDYHSDPDIQASSRKGVMPLGMGDAGERFVRAWRGAADLRDLAERRSPSLRGYQGAMELMATASDAEMSRLAGALSASWGRPGRAGAIRRQLQRTKDLLGEWRRPPAGGGGTGTHPAVCVGEDGSFLEFFDFYRTDFGAAPGDLGEAPAAGAPLPVSGSASDATVPDGDSGDPGLRHVHRYAVSLLAAAGGGGARGRIVDAMCDLQSECRLHRSDLKFVLEGLRWQDHVVPW